METIPLADGDLRWVFPDLVDEPEVRDILRQAAARIEQLAGHLEVRPAWTGSGLEFHRYPGRSAASVWGCAETDEVSLIVELAVPTNPIEWTPTAPPRWQVDARIAVRCDSPSDCGMHDIETKAASVQSSPRDAAESLLAMSTWLLRRGTEEPPSSWRQRDQSSGHA
jgi:hypothetical protein